MGDTKSAFFIKFKFNDKFMMLNICKSKGLMLR